MKKIKLPKKLILSSFLLAAFAKADGGANQSAVKLYVDFGPNFTSNTDDGQRGTLSTGFNLGLNTAFLFGSTGISIGLDYTSLESTVSNFDIVIQGQSVQLDKVKYASTFLDFPVNFVYSLQRESGSITFFVGPYIGIPTRDAKITAEEGGESVTVDASVKTVFGANAKVNCLWKVSEATELGFDIFYKRSLTDLSEESGNQSYWTIGSGLAARFF